MKKKGLFLLCLMLALSLPDLAAQQSGTVKGRVLDGETNEPLIGASVIISGTTRGTATDVNGNFELTDVPEKGSLDFTYLGFDTQSVAVGGRTLINITMRPTSNQIEELVVVGYNVQRKRDVLGAVNKIDGADLAQIPVPSAQLALQGRVPGVQVAASSGAPGANVSVRVRGVGSINSSNEPLYIIDGIQIEGGLNAVSPNDIEDITVLKDASATSIYGSRGSNGIVIITTKKGSAGKATVSFNGEGGLQYHGYLTPMVNTTDYISLYNEAARNDNAEGGIPRQLIEGSYLDGLADVDHVKELFRNAGLQRYELSVTGGNDRTTYAMSGSYFSQDGIIKNSGYQKISFRSNVQSDVKPWLNMGMNVIGSMAETQSIPSSGDGYQSNEGGSAIRYALFRTSAVPTRAADGSYVDLPSAYFGNSVYNTFFGDGYNPIGVINNTDRVRDEKAIIASTNITIRLPLNITSRTVAGLDYMSGSYRQFNQNWGTGGRINNPNSLMVENYNAFNWTFNSVLNWNETFAEHHNLSAMAGFEALRSTNYSMANTDQNFVDDLIQIGKGLDEQRRTSYESGSASTLASFFGSINYNYRQKYYAAATVRHDGTSRFQGANRWGTFYSISGGWNIEQEAFMQSAEFIDILKLRAGWGTAGNQNVGIYANEDRYMPNYNYPFGGLVNQGYAQTLLGNPDLRWETSSQFNVGIDMAFLKQTLGFSVDYFYKKSSDMLMLATLPPSTGEARPAWVNNGSMMNTGIDMEVFYRRNFKNAGFEVRVNGGWLKNKVLSIAGAVPGGRVDNGVYVTLTEAGYPVGSFYMLEMDGIFQNNLEILTSPSQSTSGDIMPGDVKYVNQNGDLVIDQADRVHVGSSIPTFTTGISLSGYWKNLDFSCFFQGAFGHKIYMQVFQDTEGFYRGLNVTQNYYDNHWTGEGTSNTQPRASWKAKSNNARVSTRFLHDASYLRLKNIQIGYTIPNTQKIGIEKLRVYVAATNLFTLTQFPGMDPEMTVSANAANEGDRGAGIDWGTYPIAKSVTVGINLTF